MIISVSKYIFLFTQFPESCLSERDGTEYSHIIAVQFLGKLQRLSDLIPCFRGKSDDEIGSHVYPQLPGDPPIGLSSLI